MSPDASTAAGNAASPLLPSSSSSSSSSFSSLPADQQHPNTRRRRKTESAVNQPHLHVHVPHQDPHESLCRRSIVNRARTITFSAGSNPRQSEGPSVTRSKPGMRPTGVGVGVMMAAEGREAGRATALKTATPAAGSCDNNDYYSPSARPTVPRTTTTTTTSTIVSPTSSSSHSSSSAAFAAASHTSSPSAVPRPPQSRFSFEYKYPLRKRALTSSHTSAANASVQNGDDTHPGPDPTPTPQQRTILYDRPRRSVPNFHLSQVRDPAGFGYRPTSPRRAVENEPDSAPPLDAPSTVRATNPNAPKRRKSSLYDQQSIPDVNDRMSASSVVYAQGRTPADERSRGVDGFDRYSQSGDGNKTPVADDTRAKNEDIFLNIARSDSGRRDSFGRSELRRSRFRMSGSGLRSSTSRVSEQMPHPEQLRLNTYDSPLHPHQESPSTPHTAALYSYSASAHPLDEHSRPSSSAYVPSSRSAIGLPRSRLGRSSPEPLSYSPESYPERRGSLHESRAYRQSTLSSIRGSRQPSSSDVTERARFESERSRQDGTESTLSTTAPSTVWDELEDLKSRIKKLELTGKLPPSSQEAISSASGERPPTATTTMTTVSSSPRRSHKTSTFSGEAEGPSPVHPLLQSALVNAKDVLSNEVYTALEVTATDALALSTLLGSNKAPSGTGSVVNGYSTSDRQARRKADSVCRSLTELCLALSDEQHRRQSALVVNGRAEEEERHAHDDDTLTPTLPFRRSTTLDSDGLVRRQSTKRVGSRLETRRSSVATAIPSPESQHGDQNNEPVSEAKVTHSPSSPAPTRLSRLSTSLRTKRHRTDDEALVEQTPQVRSPTRSIADLSSAANNYRVSPRQRMSHGYTASQSKAIATPDRNPRFSLQPQPSQLPQPRTPTLSQSAIPLRRTLMTPSYTPATARSNIQAGYRRYGAASGLSSATNTSDGSIEESVLSPRPEASQTRIIAPSSKLATSYTPISQNRVRTNSLGARKFGLRPRSLAVSDDAINTFDDRID
ncbi:putative LPXTG-motif cell wall anchor domain protein [Aspergillus brunneoviolaceus CBS 621.78]|uniref:Uncharacterized protein n=1 Tax=Aspergillus brunneoviolaceus CBS 621.78 TaxID=1450534 RepID=A0ACD1FWR3_9EURO|nr:hypothetical protein BO95DRAFT_268098 [Aspergillus brunneoviolaceus CBS 621.78]RAH41458.1 hypothetical protein BO95DRAFT_268098 [Aspergillus brunneoviolaceus CBS 621.78]